MTSKDLIGLSITIVIGLAIIIVGIILISGKGSFLIAGYNTLSNEEKEKYDHKKLACFIGKILFPLGLSIPTIAIVGIYKISWLPFVFILLTISLVIFAAIYCNTSNRFKK